ncbi:FidL-like protein [Kluyvera sp. STS39-E]|uniref:FidL-like protein n=1 Tax=Kluyvera sp. STS39-E TaxID=3234748 RepID=UPI0034C600AC
MKQKKTLLAVIALNLLLILGTVLWFRHSTQLSLTCQGSLTYKESLQDNHFTFEGMVVMHFTPDGTGYFNMNGEVVNGGQHWEVSRQESFHWKYVHETFYEMSITQVEKFGHDNVPAEVFDKYVKGVSSGQKRLLNIRRLPDRAVIIGNFYSPILVCTG